MKLTFVLFLAGLHLCFGIPTNGTSIATFLQQTKPIQVSFCKGLGYNTTSKINFLLESDPLKIMNKVMFRALSVLDRTGCSKLIKLYTCSLFVPSSNEKFGAIPPCRSSCNSIEKSCGRLLRFAAFFSPLSTGPCKTTKKGGLFRGSISKTRGGLQCQKWSEQTPHRHALTPKTHPNDGLDSNYCRNPDGEPDGPWCYTMSKGKRWDYCDIPMCSIRLYCELMPTKGCIDWKFNKTSNKYEKKIVAKPRRIQISDWFARINFNSLKKMIGSADMGQILAALNNRSP